MADSIGPPTMPVCVGDLHYVGQADLARDLENFKAALASVSVTEAFLPANTPGTIEHWMLNEHYKSDEEFVFAIADTMHEEYRAIVDAGFLLQIDDPDLPDGWNCLPDITLPDYRKYAAMRVDALNHALTGIPRKRFVCMSLGQPPRSPSRRHPAQGHHRPDLSGEGGELLDRSVEPMP